jgi:hypothetical protein
MPARVFVSTPDLRPSLLSVLEGLASSELLARLATTISLSPVLLPRLSQFPLAGQWLALRLQRIGVLPFLSGKIDNIGVENWPAEPARALPLRLSLTGSGRGPKQISIVSSRTAIPVSSMLCAAWNTARRKPLQRKKHVVAFAFCVRSMRMRARSMRCCGNYVRGFLVW